MEQRFHLEAYLDLTEDLDLALFQYLMRFRFTILNLNGVWMPQLLGKRMNS